MLDLLRTNTFVHKKDHCKNWSLLAFKHFIVHDKWVGIKPSKIFDVKNNFSFSYTNQILIRWRHFYYRQYCFKQSILSKCNTELRPAQHTLCAIRESEIDTVCNCILFSFRRMLLSPSIQTDCLCINALVVIYCTWTYCE